MIIACPACESRFTVDPARLAPGGRAVKCSRCGYRWRVDAEGQQVAQPESAAEQAESALPPGPSAREILAQRADISSAAIRPSPQPESATPHDPEPGSEQTGAAGREVPEQGDERVATEPDNATEKAGTAGRAEHVAGAVQVPVDSVGASVDADAAADQVPGRPDLTRLTPRQRQKLQDAQKRKSRLRVLVLFLLVLVSVVALVGLMKKGPQIERALQESTQPSPTAPANSPPPGQSGTQ